MNICELINECGGPDKVRIQFLDQCVDTLDYSAKRGGTMVKFGTDQVATLDGLPMCGVIVWLDRNDVKAAIALAKGEAK